MTKNMKTRILTALILGPAVIFCIVHGSLAFAILLLAVFLGAVYESLSIAFCKNVSCLNNRVVTSGFGIGDKRQFSISALKIILIIALPIASLAYIRYSDKGPFMAIWLFAAIWCFDTFALIGGKALGGPKLAPVTSPNKTWSGFICGIVASCLVSFAIYLVFSFKTNIFIFVAISFLIAVLSQIGDLAESKFKRHYKVKDSGSIIPGHGGVLDRMDGFLLTAPFMALINLVSFGLNYAFHIPLIIT